MNAAYMSAIAALAGSAIGALASFGSTWITQKAQDRASRFHQVQTRKEQLYSDFIDEAARIFVDALVHEIDDPSKLVNLYALVGKLRLFASSKVVSSADEVVEHILSIYAEPRKNFRELMKGKDKQNLDVLRAFSEASRDDLARRLGPWL